MNESRHAPASRPEIDHGVGNYRVAIVGAATLKGKELADVLSERNFPRRDVKLLDDDESLGQLEAVGDEVSFVQAVRPEHFENVDFAFFASDENFTRKHWQMAQRAGSVIVDLSFGLENEPGASLRSPWVERQLGKTPLPELQPAPVVVAHAASVVLGLVILRAQQAGTIRSLAATLYQPASEQGRRGMTNCTSRPSTCSPFTICLRTCLTRKLRSICWSAMATNPLSSSTTWSVG